MLPLNRMTLADTDPFPVATPGPAGLISSSVGGDPLGFLGGLIERYGDVVRYETKFGPCFLFVHPEHVQTILHRENYRRASLVKMMLGDGLLASDGPRWRSQRRLMQKDFLPSAMAGFVEIMVQQTRSTVQNWEAAARGGERVDITAAMTQLTLRIIVSSLFSEELDSPVLSALCWRGDANHHRSGENFVDDFRCSGAVYTHQHSGIYRRQTGDRRCVLRLDRTQANSACIATPA